MMRLFTLLLLASRGCRAMASRAMASLLHAAFGVFDWLQVTDFDGGLFLGLHFSFPLLGCLSFSAVSVTPNSN